MPTRPGSADHLLLVKGMRCRDDHGLDGFVCQRFVEVVAEQKSMGFGEFNVLGDPRFDDPHYRNDLAFGEARHDLSTPPAQSNQSGMEGHPLPSAATTSAIPAPASTTGSNPLVSRTEAAMDAR